MHRIVSATLLCALGLSSAASGQQTKPRYIAKRPLIQLRIDNVPTLRDQIAASAMGRLFAEPEVKEAANQLWAWSQQAVARRRTLRAAAVELEIELDSHDLSSVFAKTDGWTLFELAWPQVERVHVVTAAPTAGPRTGSVLAVTCLPQFEGKWAGPVRARRGATAASVAVAG